MGQISLGAQHKKEKKGGGEKEEMVRLQ